MQIIYVYIFTKTENRMVVARCYNVGEIGRHWSRVQIFKSKMNKSEDLMHRMVSAINNNVLHI